MPHRTFAQMAKRRLVGKEGRERIREVSALLAELPDYRNGPYADLRKWLTANARSLSQVPIRDTADDALIARLRERAASPNVAPP